MSSGWLLVSLFVTLACHASSVHAVQTAAGLQFDGNSRVLIAGYGGFPQRSWSILFSVLISPDTDPSIPLRGTFLSFFSQKQNSLVFSFSNPTNLQIAYGLDGTNKLNSGLGIADGQWHAVAVTFNSGSNELVFYLDGSRAFFMTVKGLQPGQIGAFFDGPGSLVLGQMQGCDGGCFTNQEGLSARMRDFSLWSHAFSYDEIYSRFGSQTVLSTTDYKSDQLVLAYLMTEGSGPILKDLSSNKLDGDLGGVVIAPAGTYYSFAFDGQAQMRREFKDNSFPATSLSIAAWIKTEPQTDSDMALFAYSTEVDAQELVIHQPQQLRIRIAGVEIETKINIADNKWHHLAVVLDLAVGRNVSVYVDGVSNMTQTLPELRLSRSGIFIVGQEPSCLGSCLRDDGGYEGFMQAVRSWTSALNAAEINLDFSRAVTTLTPSTLTQKTDTSLLFVWRALPSPDTINYGMLPDVTPNKFNAHLGRPEWKVNCPNMCNAPKGFCLESGLCECVAGVSGEDCSEGCPNGCSGRGTCVQGKCKCFPMFDGPDCSVSPFLDIGVSSVVVCQNFSSAGITRKSLFCNILEDDAAYPSSALTPANVKKFDDEALKAFKRVSASCTDQYSKKLLKSSICGRFFPKCDAKGQPRKPCTSTCNQFAGSCGFGPELCDLGIFSNSTTCFTPRPIDELSDCPRKCRLRGKCVEAKCVCDKDWKGTECEIWQGNMGTKFGIGFRQTFCDRVEYVVPAIINTTWADIAAKSAYDMLQPYCKHSELALELLKLTMCATAHPQLNTTSGDILKPCRSMCQDYGALCQMSGADVCFQEMYADPPNCFIIRTQNQLSELTREMHAPKCTNTTICVHGFCKEGSCVCDSEWYGSTCNISLPSCVGYCSDHGVCQAGLCRCLPGWTGSACNEQIPGLCDADCLQGGSRSEACCQTISSVFSNSYDDAASTFTSMGCASNCSGHGSCGTRCPTYVIQTISSPCLANTTNSNSTNCTTTTTTTLATPQTRTMECEIGPVTHCRCDAGFYGEACELGGGLTGCGVNCSGHGVCHEHRCVCDIGYGGKVCDEEWPCVADCSGHGSCSLGQCTCDDGFVGIACQHAIPKCPTDMRCKNGGMCFNGECSCPSGYAGVDCGKRLTCGVDFVCAHGGKCNSATSRCKCSPLWGGFDCTQELRAVLVAAEKDLPELEHDISRLKRKSD